MAADFKTNILLREEKGVFGVAYKRLMMAGVVAAFFFFIAKLIFGGLAVPLTFLVFIGAVIMSGQRGGLSLSMRLYLSFRGNLIIKAAKQPGSMLAQVARNMDLPIHLAFLDASEIFASYREQRSFDFADLVVLTSADDDPAAGLVCVDDPLEELLQLGELEAI